MVELKKKKSFKSALAGLPLEFLLITGLFIVALVLFAWITHEVVFQKKDLYDRNIAAFISTYTTEATISLMKFFTVFGSGKFLFPAYTLLATYYVMKRKRMLALHIGLIAISGTALSHGIKRVVQRARPDVPLIESLRTYSFPSGHALSSVIFCSILVYLLWRANIQLVWKWLFALLLFLFAMTIGISRIILKMHYPTDVIAGFCLGFAWVILSFFLLGLKSHGPQETVKLPL